MYGNTLELHVLTHTFPSRRSSDRVAIFRIFIGTASFVDGRRRNHDPVVGVAQSRVEERQQHARLLAVRVEFPHHLWRDGEHVERPQVDMMLCMIAPEE